MFPDTPTFSGAAALFSSQGWLAKRQQKYHGWRYSLWKRCDNRVLVEWRADFTVTFKQNDGADDWRIQKTFLVHLSLVPAYSVGTEKVDSNQSNFKTPTIKSDRLSVLTRLPAVHGTFIMSGKKSEVIHVDAVNANMAETNGFARCKVFCVWYGWLEPIKQIYQTRGLGHRGWGV